MNLKTLNRRAFLKRVGHAGAVGMALPLLGCLPGAKFDKNPVVLMGGPTSAELAFIRDRVRVRPGETITWELQSSGHTATAYHPDTNNAYPSRIPEGATPFDSPLLFNKGDTYAFTFKVEGVYNYFCRPHEGAGMVGIVVVGNPLDGPGLVPPQTELPVAARDHLQELIGWAKKLPKA